MKVALITVTIKQGARPTVITLYNLSLDIDSDRKS